MKLSNPSPSFSPSANTLPITGSTLTLTGTSTPQLLINYDGSHRNYISTTSGGIFVIDQQDVQDFRIRFQGAEIVTINSNVVTFNAAFGAFATGANTPVADRARFCTYSVPGLSGSGVGDGGAAQCVSFVTNDLDRVICSNTLLTTTIPIALKSYTVATVPSASPAGQIIYVSDAAVAPCVAFSNGSVWKRCDNAATTIV